MAINNPGQCRWKRLDNWGGRFRFFLHAKQFQFKTNLFNKKESLHDQLYSRGFPLDHLKKNHRMNFRKSEGNQMAYRNKTLIQFTTTETM